MTDLRIVLAVLLDVLADALILGIRDRSCDVAVRRHVRLNKRHQVAIIDFHRLHGFKFVLNINTDRIGAWLGIVLELFDHIFVYAGQAFEFFSIEFEDRLQIFFLEFVVNLQFRKVPIHRLESFGKFGEFILARQLCCSFRRRCNFAKFGKSLAEFLLGLSPDRSRYIVCSAIAVEHQSIVNEFGVERGSLHRHHLSVAFALVKQAIGP